MKKRISAFDIVNYAIMAMVLLLVIYPLYFVIIASFSNPEMVNHGDVILLPKGVTLEGYKRVLNESSIWTGYRNSIFYTAAHTAIGLAVTLPAAYAMSRRDFQARKLIMVLFAVTMFFGGGLIPTYILFRGLGLINKVWAVILPGVMSVWNMIVARTYFQTSIPLELQEASKIDGCSDARLFMRIIVPLSTPIIAVIALYLAVGMWNSYFNAMIFLTDSAKFPLQLILRDILIKHQLTKELTLDIANVKIMAEQARIAELIKYVMIIVASIPVFIAYPFVQKYFVKGVMIGAIKG